MTGPEWPLILCYLSFESTLVKCIEKSGAAQHLALSLNQDIKRSYFI